MLAAPLRLRSFECLLPCQPVAFPPSSSSNPDLPRRTDAPGLLPVPPFGAAAAAAAMAAAYPPAPPANPTGTARVFVSGLPVGGGVAPDMLGAAFACCGGVRDVVVVQAKVSGRIGRSRTPPPAHPLPNRRLSFPSPFTARPHSSHRRCHAPSPSAPSPSPPLTPRGRA